MGCCCFWWCFWGRGSTGSFTQEKRLRRRIRTVLMDDLRRNSDINTEPSAMEETENYVIDYILHLDQVDQAELEQRLQPGDEMLNTYNDAMFGTLKKMTFSETEDGISADLTISLFAVFTKTAVLP